MDIYLDSLRRKHKKEKARVSNKLKAGSMALLPLMLPILCSPCLVFRVLLHSSEDCLQSWT